MKRNEDVWSPEQYERFRREREQPGLDLIDMVRPSAGARAIDLGCGTGALTERLHRQVGAAHTEGVDGSPAMLARAAERAARGLTFRQAEMRATLATRGPDGRGWDVIFSNAALHWLPDHERLVAELSDAVAPGGQLALQVPANDPHPTYALVREIATEEPFRTALAGDPWESPVLPPERYAELLYAHGWSEQHVKLRVYGHELPSTAAALEWLKGGRLTTYRERLGPELYEQLLQRYADSFPERIGSTRPYFFTFRRVLVWARKNPQTKR